MPSRLRRTLSRLRRSYRTVTDLPYAVRRLEALLLETTLTPVERHLMLEAMSRTDGLFDGTYDVWRVKRINKVLDIYGLEYFCGKRVLELGAGHADIGAFFAEIGADVLCLEGRQENVNYARLKHRNIKNLKCEQADLEADFSNFGRFDLIINFGLLYHLRKVEEHLKCCFSMTDDVLLETVVCDSTDPNRIFFVDEDAAANEEALGGVGSRPSPFYIERIAAENGFEAVRYFTPDLNYQRFEYNWEHKNNNRLGDWWLRRFWRLRRKTASSD